MTCSLRSGFTLVEMAVVLIVIGLMMLTVFPALTALRTGTQRSLTESNLQALMTATAAYVQANGCLPCPAQPTACGPNFGLVGTIVSASCSSLTHPACGSCTQPEGIPPFASLGIPASTAHDGGGHWITMRVDPALTANFGIAPPTRPCTCTGPANGPCTASSTVCTCSIVNTVCTVSPSQAGISLQGLCEPSGTGAGQLSKAGSITVQTPSLSSQSAAVIFVSHGANGYGSFISRQTGGQLSFPAGYASCASGGYAECNAAGTALFYDAMTTVGSSIAYDDTLAFADRNTLVSMLGNGSCQTVW